MKISTTHKHVLRKAVRGLGVSTVLFALVGGGVGASSAPRPEISLTDSSAQPPAVFVAVSPLRVLDTRPAPVGPIGVATAAKLGQGQQMNVRLAGDGAAIPANATAALINVTLDEDASLSSFLTIWPAGEARPNASANNAEPGLVASNSLLAKIGDGGSISIFNQQGAVNVIVDVVGYTVPLSDVGGPGNDLLSGNGAPAAGTGLDGDFYVDVADEVLYGPKTNGAWPTPGISLGGGSQVITGATPPNGAVGEDGDIYIDTTTGTVYVMTNGGWVANAGSLKGVPGAASEFNTGGVTVNVGLLAPGASDFVPFSTDGPEFGTVSTPPTPAVGFVAATPGIYEVTYGLGISAAALASGTVQVVVGDTAQGPASTFLLSADAEVSGSVLVQTTTPNTPIRLRYTNTGVLAINVSLDNTSFMTVKQLLVN